MIGGYTWISLKVYQNYMIIGSLNGQVVEPRPINLDQDHGGGILRRHLPRRDRMEGGNTIGRWYSIWASMMSETKDVHLHKRTIDREEEGIIIEEETGGSRMIKVDIGIEEMKRGEL